MRLHRIRSCENFISETRLSNVVLELKHVSAGYGETLILENVNIGLARGERVAVLGRNGAGKTTILATAMGLTRLHHGEVWLLGNDVTHLPTHKRSVMGLGMVPQTRDIFPSLTVEENLRAAMRGDAAIDEAYALFPRLKERRRNGGGQLSGGEQQMLSIARALMARPEILLLDEPLEGLAPVIRDMLMGVLQQLCADRAKTVVLVEQHLSVAVDFADRALLIDNGGVVYDGPAAALKADEDLLHRHIGLALVK